MHSIETDIKMIRELKNSLKWFFRPAVSYYIVYRINNKSLRGWEKKRYSKMSPYMQQGTRECKRYEHKEFLIPLLQLAPKGLWLLLRRWIIALKWIKRNWMSGGRLFRSICKDIILFISCWWIQIPLLRARVYGLGHENAKWMYAQEWFHQAKASFAVECMDTQSP